MVSATHDASMVCVHLFEHCSSKILLDFVSHNSFVYTNRGDNQAYEYLDTTGAVTVTDERKN